MKRYVCKFLLFLLKNISGFIPYFKPKYMTLLKSTILNAINHQVITHLNSYQDINNFNVNNGVISVSNMNHHKIQYEIIDPNSDIFNVFLVYENGLISRKYQATITDETYDNTIEFCKYFKSNPFDFTELFERLNNSI